MCESYVDLSKLRLLLTHCEDPVALLVVDEGQNFARLFRDWCRQDDAFTDGEIPESEWRSPADFLRERGCKVFEPAVIEDLGDYY
jgi:hypothetical protein